MFHSADEAYTDETTSGAIPEMVDYDTTEDCYYCGAEAGELCRTIDGTPCNG